MYHHAVINDSWSLNPMAARVTDFKSDIDGIGASQASTPKLGAFPWAPTVRLPVLMRIGRALGAQRYARAFADTRASWKDVPDAEPMLEQAR